MALFLIVAGTTGALLPWQEALTLAGRPMLSRAAPPAAGARPLDGITLAERVERQTGGRVPYVPLDTAPDHVAMLDVAAASGRPAPGYDRVWADPYSGAVRLRYRQGVLADGAQNIMPFLYDVHRSLALGAWGTWALGIAALIWTIDCFVGFYLTLPRPRRGVAAIGPARRGWWARWLPSWTLRRRVRGHKRTFDLHRAGGLWLWPLLFVFAWSSVGFNLSVIQAPVMRAFGATDYAELPSLARPVDTPTVDRRAGLAIGRDLMRAEAKRRGFTIGKDGLLAYDPATGAYTYRARTSLDASQERAATGLRFSGITGRLLLFDPPQGRSAADTAMSWFYMLHMAQVFGLPYRLFVSASGLAVAALSVTGILIWMKKRSARLLGMDRAAAASLATGTS